MLRSRVLLTVLALLAVPFVASAAQSRGKEKVRTQNEASLACTPEQAAALARARAAGHQVPVGLENKNCEVTPPPPPPPAPVPPPPPPPPPAPPPSGIHSAVGVVYEDVDGNGRQDMFGGEMGLAGWTVELYWNGQFVSSASTDQNGAFAFPGLGNSTWVVCVVAQAGYVRTQPANGNACGGAGYEHIANSPFMTFLDSNFGFMLQ